jgi:hypothetical protein
VSCSNINGYLRNYQDCLTLAVCLFMLSAVLRDLVCSCLLLRVRVCLQLSAVARALLFTYSFIIYAKYATLFSMLYALRSTLYALRSTLYALRLKSRQS